MIHVVVMKCLIGLPLLMHIELFMKESEPELELLCTDSTFLDLSMTKFHQAQSHSCQHKQGIIFCCL
jgi:hypothetical protein